MSDTPRTDAKTQFFGWNPEEGEEFVTANFARELERENAALRAEALKTQIGQHAEIKNYAASVAELERENAALREMLDLAFRIPNMTDAELAELIRNCRAALGTAAKEVQP